MKQFLSVWFQKVFLAWLELIKYQWNDVGEGIRPADGLTFIFYDF